MGFAVALGIAFGYEYLSEDPSISRWLAFAALAYAGVLLLVITPQRMWVNSQENVKKLEDLAKPNLRIVFEPDTPPYLQEVFLGQPVHAAWERRYRIGIRNESSQVIRNVRVVLESFQQLFEGEVRPADSSDLH